MQVQSSLRSKVTRQSLSISKRPKVNCNPRSSRREDSRYQSLLPDLLAQNLWGMCALHVPQRDDILDQELSSIQLGPISSPFMQSIIYTAIILWSWLVCLECSRAALAKRGGAFINSLSSLVAQGSSATLLGGCAAHLFCVFSISGMATRP
jgi:hypothetical protein